MLSGNDANATYPISIDILTLAEASPAFAEKLLECPKVAFEELETAILKAQEAVLEHRGHQQLNFTVKEFVRPRLTGVHLLLCPIPLAISSTCFS